MQPTPSWSQLIDANVRATRLALAARHGPVVILALVPAFTNGPYASLFVTNFIHMVMNDPTHRCPVPSKGMLHQFAIDYARTPLHLKKTKEMIYASLDILSRSSEASVL